MTIDLEKERLRESQDMSSNFWKDCYMEMRLKSPPKPELGPLEVHNEEEYLSSNVGGNLLSCPILSWVVLEDLAFWKCLYSDVQLYKSDLGWNVSTEKKLGLIQILVFF